MLQQTLFKKSDRMELNLKCSMKKNVIYWIIHIDFQIQKIYPSRLANPINKLMLHTRLFIGFATLSGNISCIWKSMWINHYFIPKKCGVLCYTLRTIWVSISASFPGSNFSIFWLIFFKLHIGSDIREEWYGIANGLISFRNNRVMALDLWKKFVYPQYLQNKWMNFVKICICIDIYKI